METTLPLPFLASVAVPWTGPMGENDGLSREQLACLGAVFLEATPQNLADIQAFVSQDGLAFEPYIDVTQLESQDDILSLLDGGARKVFVRPEQFDALSEHGSRVAQAAASSGQGLPATEGGLLVSGIETTAGASSAVVEQLKSRKISSIFVKPAPGAHLAEFVELARQIPAIPVLPSSSLVASSSSPSSSKDVGVDVPAAGKLAVSKLLAASWASDRDDQLVPTVVTDESGVALGLVYSSEESVGEALRTRTGVYQSRKRGLWYKGATSGDTQELVRLSLDCDSDALKFVVRQKGRFCHLYQAGCFGGLGGVAKLERTLRARRESAPQGSYTARLFSDEKLLRAKIMEEAEELCNAKTSSDVAFEAADLIYFALTKAVASCVSLADIERNLDAKSWKVKRRTGDAKGKWAEKEGIKSAGGGGAAPATTAAAPPPAAPPADSERIAMRRYDASTNSAAEIQEALKRPSQKSSDAIMKIIGPIVEDVRTNGDKALLAYTHKFEKATSLTSPVLRAPFPESLMRLAPETARAIDVSFENIRRFHAAQKEQRPLQVETMPGVVCSRFSRPIERVGLYVPGGTAVLPSTALMLGVPAMVAGCRRIVLASPPRADGTVTPEIVYVAHKVGAESIVLAGGAQAVAAMAYGTESVTKVDKILGPGNQFVTAAKMLVSNDTNAGVGIDMPAGPSEVLVVADAGAEPVFVASDLLSQAEHGVDSQVVLIAVGLDEAGLRRIEDEVHRQATALPRVDIVRGSIKHSLTISVRTIDEAMAISNDYAPEHLILQVRDAEAVVDKVMNAGSVFIGQWTPESVGDYSAGVNHSLRESFFPCPATFLLISHAD